MTVDEDLCLENLDEFINDDNKPVTYKWLSRSLSLHVNTAKQLLYKFVEQQRNKKENDSLSVNYVLAGVVDNNGTKGHKVQIVPETKLEAAKAEYKVLTSCHVYSVQKGKPKDTNVLYMADYELLKQHLHNSNEHSAIQCSTAVARTNDEMIQFEQARGSSTQQAPARTSASKSKADSSTAKKTTGIAGMFSQAASKSKAKSDSSPKESKPAQQDAKSAAQEKPKEKPKAGGMASFFGKQGNKPKVKVEEEETMAVEKPTPKESPEKESPKKSSPVDTKRGIKHKGRLDDGDPKSKKHKRIKVQVESSSEDEGEMVVEEPILCPDTPEPDPPQDDSPPPQPSPTPSPTKRAVAPDNDMCGKIKKRKLVDKTHMNDEGFIVTEKVYEDEWIDAPPPTKPSPSKNIENKTSSSTGKAKKPEPAKKVSPNAKNSGKQTSLMNFFKKK